MISIGRARGAWRAATMADGGSFALLGGYGQLGRATSRVLVRDGAKAVTVAGRNAEKARSAADQLSPASSATVETRKADAEDAEALADLLACHDVLIHAAPLAKKETEALLNALLKTSGRAVVVSHDKNAVATLRSAHDKLLARGASVVVDAGADPGLPGLVGHLAAQAHGAAKTWKSSLGIEPLQSVTRVWLTSSRVLRARRGLTSTFGDVRGFSRSAASHTQVL